MTQHLTPRPQTVHPAARDTLPWVPRLTTRQRRALAARVTQLAWNA